MNRYTLELIVVVLGSLFLMQELLGPLLVQLHPVFSEPAITYPDGGWHRLRIPGEVHFSSARLWVYFILTVTVVFGWGYIRQDELEAHQNRNSDDGND